MEGRAAGPYEVVASQRDLLEEQGRVIAAQAKLVARLEGQVERLEARAWELEGPAGRHKGMPGVRAEPAARPERKGPRTAREPNARHPEGTRHAVDTCPGCGRA